MTAYYGEKKIKPNVAFMIYFTVMFCFYTYTYIQLADQLGIIVYVVLRKMSPRMRIYLPERKQCFFYLVWFGGLTALLFASQYFWAYSTYAGSKTMLTVFRIFVIGFIIFWYCDSKEKTISVLLSFIVGAFVMGIVAMLTTPLSMWGQTSKDEGFGNVIGQHRNQVGAVAASLVAICSYLHKLYRVRWARILAAFFILLTLVSGSRSSFLQIIIVVGFIVLFGGEGFSKKVKNIVLACLLGILALAVIYSVPFLYNTIWVRIEAGVSTVLGIEVADKSALGREYYKEIAFLMFLQRPWLGYGLDGFVCFLRDNPWIMGTYISAVYSHCNYAELAADLGIVGLAVWYLPVLSVWKEIWKVRKNSKWAICLFAVFSSMIIFDYSRIPWETHLVMYLWFIVILLCRYEAGNGKYESTMLNNI